MIFLLVLIPLNQFARPDFTQPKTYSFLYYIACIPLNGKLVSLDVLEFTPKDTIRFAGS